SIGVGGGSIFRVRDDAITVGPDSVGGAPGPACFGMGGKEATIVEKLELPPKELEAWCKAAKAAMGCGGVVEDGAIILQGDLRRRLEAWLTARGVRKVTVA
ncbi:MAG: hypothetical protein K8M05_35375, partial [Deltaproteobacteria bacterium]|nr:hypothetical protein [Kofleriaceae bacterium]